jgi:zinc/manganese transport system permease protein
MLEYFTDPFASEIGQRALQGGLLAAVTMALVGSWVVVRGLTFAGDALAHGVLPGVALAVLWGVDMKWGALASALVMMVGVTAARRTGRVADDASIGLLFVGMLALGVVIISSSDAHYGDLEGILFGDVLTVQESDIRLQRVVAVGTLVAVLLLHRRFLALSFDPRKAAVLGQQPGLAHIALLVLLAVAVVASFQIVGTLLVLGLMVAPAATALLLVRRMPLVLMTSVLLGCLSVWLGLTISYHENLAAAATVAVVAVMIFFTVAAVRGLFEMILRSHQPRQG